MIDHAAGEATSESPVLLTASLRSQSDSVSATLLLVFLSRYRMIAFGGWGREGERAFALWSHTSFMEKENIFLPSWCLSYSPSRPSSSFSLCWWLRD